MPAIINAMTRINNNMMITKAMGVARTMISSKKDVAVDEAEVGAEDVAEGVIMTVIMMITTLEDVVEVEDVAGEEAETGITRVNIFM